MEDKNLIIMVTIPCLTIIMCVSMFLGFNGTLRTLIVGVIAALAGWVIPMPKLKGGD